MLTIRRSKAGINQNSSYQTWPNSAHLGHGFVHLLPADCMFNCAASLWWYHPYSCISRGRKGLTLLSQDCKEVIFTCFQRYKKQRRENLFRLRLLSEITPWGIRVPSSSSSAVGCRLCPSPLQWKVFPVSLFCSKNGKNHWATQQSRPNDMLTNGALTSFNRFYRD